MGACTAISWRCVWVHVTVAVCFAGWRWWLGAEGALGSWLLAGPAAARNSLPCPAPAFADVPAAAPRRSCGASASPVPTLNRSKARPSGCCPSPHPLPTFSIRRSCGASASPVPALNRSKARPSGCCPSPHPLPMFSIRRSCGASASPVPALNRRKSTPRAAAPHTLADVLHSQVLRHFGEPPSDIQQKQKYAAWRAAEISKAVKEGRQPEAPPAAGQVRASEWLLLGWESGDGVLRGVLGDTAR